jgi:hypothetical protein
MRDTQPREPVEFIELEANKDLIAARSAASVGESLATGGASGGATTITASEETSAGPSVSEQDMTGPIADPPEPFEYPFDSDT